MGEGVIIGVGVGLGVERGVVGVVVVADIGMTDGSVVAGVNIESDGLGVKMEDGVGEEDCGFNIAG